MNLKMVVCNQIKCFWKLCFWTYSIWVCTAFLLTVWCPNISIISMHYHKNFATASQRLLWFRLNRSSCRVFFKKKAKCYIIKAESDTTKLSWMLPQTYQSVTSLKLSVASLKLSAASLKLSVASQKLSLLHY